MSDFCCFTCRRYKKIELVGLVRANKQKVCKACLENIKEADKRRIAELKAIS